MIFPGVIFLIAVLGTDNYEILCETATPPLPSIALDGQNVGQLCARLLDQHMHRQKVEPLVDLASSSTTSCAASSTRKSDVHASLRVSPRTAFFRHLPEETPPPRNILHWSYRRAAYSPLPTPME